MLTFFRGYFQFVISLCLQELLKSSKTITIKQSEMREPSWEGASLWYLLSDKLQTEVFIMLQLPGHLQTLQDLSEIGPSLCSEPCSL